MFLTAFIYGLLAASLALIVEVVTLDLRSGLQFSLSQPELTQFFTLVLAVIIEEGCRLLLLTQYAKRYFTVTQSLDLRTILQAGLFFGLGFATPELLMILGATGRQNYPILPVGGITLVHTALSLLYALSLGNKLRFGPWIIVVLGVLLHFAYNAFLAR